MTGSQLFPRLYDSQPFCTEFDADIIGCRAEAGGYTVRLSVNGFFPVGGGQSCDTGWIGNVPVTSVTEEGGEILHHVPVPFSEGERVFCRVNAGERIMKMQNHTGEHILSGLIFKKYGFRNVGFHLGNTDTTADFDGILSEEMLYEILSEANRAVREDLPVTVFYPTEKELAGLFYRSKLENIDGVRLVAIGDLDLCACCAPHVERTGQIGTILITECKTYKKGCRMHILCGERATEYLNGERTRVDRACRLLSATHEALPDAVERVLEENRTLRQRITELNEKSNRLIADAVPEDGGAVYYEDDRSDPEAARRLSLLLAGKGSPAAGVFSPEGGRFFIASKTLPLRKYFGLFAKETGAKGGGSDELICGTVGKGDYREVFRQCFGGQNQ